VETQFLLSSLLLSLRRSALEVLQGKADTAAIRQTFLGQMSLPSCHLMRSPDKVRNLGSINSLEARHKSQTLHGMPKPISLVLP